MIRKIIAGFLFAFVAAGCQSQPVDPDLVDELDSFDGAHELGAKVGELCGGFAGIACDPGLFCNYDVEAQCGAGDQTGICEAPPQACTNVYDPVCGCDGVTYSNACFAAANSVSVAHEGACERGGGAAEGEPCGGFAGIECEKGLFCDFAPETICGSGDQMGTCTAPPAACIQVMKPVCGCDGVTYKNACVAAANQVSVLHDGACK